LTFKTLTQVAQSSSTIAIQSPYTMLNFLLLIIFNLVISKTDGFCDENTNDRIAGNVGVGGQTIFATCGQLAANPQHVRNVCSLDPRSEAEGLSPAVRCGETCGSGGSQSPNSPILGLVGSGDGRQRPVVFERNCGWLADQPRRVIDKMCSLDLDLWDLFAPSRVCCQTCSLPSDLTTPG